MQETNLIQGGAQFPTPVASENIRACVCAPPLFLKQVFAVGKKYRNEAGQFLSFLPLVLIFEQWNSFVPWAKSKREMNPESWKFGNLEGWRAFREDPGSKWVSSGVGDWLDGCGGLDLPRGAWGWLLTILCADVMDKLYRLVYEWMMIDVLRCRNRAVGY